ncbi:hypothetical protein [Haloarcula laminariae]|uniref:hypothetical protein n=1 Tax=Haloarcula laminariae TaxID=2961577 RepID=UPI0021CA06D9|nr:hypothetical protein [Halomicroarcula laminariae]
MPEDGDSDEEEVASAEELMEHIEGNWREKVEKATLNDCEQIRAAGEYVRAAESWQDAVSRVADGLAVSEERAAWLVGLYIKIFTDPSKSVTGYGLNIGGIYFSTEKSVEELQPETRIDSVDEAEEYLREYVGVHADEADINEVAFTDDLPEEPLYPSLELDLNVPTPQLTGLTEALETITTSYHQQLATQLSTILDSYFDSLLSDALEPIADLAGQYQEIEESDFEFKWLSNVKHAAFMQLYREFCDKGNDAAAELLAAQLRDEEGIEGFKEYFLSFDEYDERQTIIEEALDAHAEGRYALSIPTLLTQLDGIFIDLALDIGLWRPDHDVTGVAVVNKGEGSPRHISEIDEEFRDYYSSRLWPNRVDILHGKRTDYADDELLSAKLIWLLFQTLHTTENIRSAEDFGDYHILRSVDENDVHSITAIADHLDYQEDYVEERCMVLEEQHAVSISENDKVSITEIGHKYLEGDRSLVD